MCISVKKPDINEIGSKSGMTNEQVEEFLALIESSRQPLSKRINVTEDSVPQSYVITRKGLGVIETEYGEFWQYSFIVNDKWKEYSVLVKASEVDMKTFSPIFMDKEKLFLRTDSGCATGQIFGDLTCDCSDQLRLAMKMLNEAGEGMIISIPRQDGRGMGISFKLATLWIQNVLGVHTVESASLLSLDGVIDLRTYSGAVCILKFFGILESCTIRLASNNPDKVNIFGENGYRVDENLLSVAIQPTGRTEHHLKAKKEHLHHEGAAWRIQMTTIEKIFTRMSNNNTLLCVGLDPDLNKFPRELLESQLKDRDKISCFLRGVVDITHQHVCSYKAQKAFFDLLPEGHSVLKEIVEYVHQVAPGVPVIIDCKVGDIDNTMLAYIEYLFGVVQADGIVVNPYMGDDVFASLTSLKDKAIVVLVKTSNVSSKIIQDVQLADGRPLWQYVLDLSVNHWNVNSNVIPVISSTDNIDFKSVRIMIPDDMPILLAGVGMQGGSHTSISKLLNSKNVGVLVNSSRGILYPESSFPWQDAIRMAAIAVKEDLNQARVHHE